MDAQVTALLRQLLAALESSEAPAISFDQPLEIHPISPEQAAAIVGCLPGSLRTWRRTKGWIKGVHYLSDGAETATDLKHWVLHHADSPEAHLNWCTRFHQARQAAMARDLGGRGKRGAA